MKSRIFLTVILAVLAMGVVNAGNNKKEKNEKTQYQVDVQLTSQNQIVVRYLSSNNNKVRILVLDNNGEQLSAKNYRNQTHLKVTYDLGTFSASNLIFKVYANKELICKEFVAVDENGIASIPVSKLDINRELKSQEILLTEQP